MRTVPCRESACCAQIVFAHNPNGRLTPYDAVPFRRDEVPPSIGVRLVREGPRLVATYDGAAEAAQVYLVHFETCAGRIRADRLEHLKQLDEVRYARIRSYLRERPVRRPRRRKPSEPLLAGGAL